MLIDCLARMRLVHGPTDPETLMCIYQIGYLQKLQGTVNSLQHVSYIRDVFIDMIIVLCCVVEKLDLADEYLRAAMLMQAKEIGADHPDTLRSAHQLALVCNVQGRWKHRDNHMERMAECCELFEVSLFPISALFIHLFIYV